MRAKTELFEQFAAAGKGLAHPARLELLDLLAQGECPVEPLAAAAGLKLSTASAHLQTLKASGLVRTRRQSTSIVYRLAGPEVGELLNLLRRVAATHLDGVAPARDRFLGRRGPDDPACEEIDRQALLERVAAGRAVVLDVRPGREYAAGHIPGAVSIPLDELADRLAELPDVEVVAYCRGEYCVLSYDAVRLLTAHGRRAVRLADGMLEWRLAQLPVERPAESTSV
ncbi:ArsR family transcriptional regulator [Pseudonocardia sediminis]|uniref:ArsR family transcriptional regulator n=1 Tax=Pseudonocardia sediminis TaxID=1397368 RepID=A0A4Q7UZL4_PSEST|nr:ArsR family transcriptional regulator [Pseudonocardia sediminis]